MLQSQLEDEENLKVLQYILYIFNVVFFLAGAVAFAVGIYVTFDTQMGYYLQGLSMDFYYAGTTVILVGSSLVVANSFLGICGAFSLSRTCLIIYQVTTCITFIILLSGSAYLLTHGLLYSQLSPYVEETMRNLIYDYQSDSSARITVDRIQEGVSCCGGSGATDYSNIHLPIPNTCRNHVTGNQFGDPCSRNLSVFMGARTGWLAGISLSLCFFQLIAVILAMYVNVFIQKVNKTYKN